MPVRCVVCHKRMSPRALVYVTSAGAYHAWHTWRPDKDEIAEAAKQAAVQRREARERRLASRLGPSYDDASREIDLLATATAALSAA